MHCFDEEWVTERGQVEQLVIQANRENGEARIAAKKAIDAFVARFPEHADSIIAFRIILDRDPTQ